MKSKIFFILFFLFLGQSVFAKVAKVQKKTSFVKWHLRIESNTDVYGEIGLDDSFVDFEKKSGELKFNLAKTKSWEVDDGEKEYSEARDERIVKITQADEYLPHFKISNIEKLKDDIYKFSGTLELNGVKKDIQLQAKKKTQASGSISLQAEYKLQWRDFKITNPVIWILRATKTPKDYISLDFELNLETVTNS